MAKQKQTALNGWLTRARQFLEEFPVDSVGSRPVLRKLRTTVHFIHLVVQGFVGNRCPLRAAALCYTTMLAFVPLLAVVFSVSKSFLRESSATVVPKVLDAIVDRVAPQLEYLPADGRGTATPAKGRVVVSAQARQQVVDSIQSFIGNINAGAVTTVGSLFLILVAVRLLMTIEQTFNDIWGVQKGRSLWRKVVYYWTSITLGSIVLLTALTVTGTAEFASALGKLTFAPGFERVLLQVVPYVILWVGFALMYALMPNTQVRFHAALIGGVVGGTLWQLNSLLNTMYVSRVVTYSKIYGALGIIPVFLVGLYFSWLIVLFGAQVSFAAQNVRTYMQQRASENVDQAGRESIACRVVLHACYCFQHGQKPPAPEELADRLRAPLQALNQSIHRLIEGGVLVEVANSEGGLQPARPPESITVADVLHVVRTHSGAYGDERKRPASEPIDQLLFDLSTTVRASPVNARFSDLADKLDAANG
ncbi:MAG TPA: YhjD/YihY/BrkB family envelope integrity protein [Verrucomicrobiae bacterium]|nr:YhjD/YihY/BrkB family envelope integrity protein [Verrucomicrobiae bacterium]